ncbi:MAG: biotin transporter BioY [Alphaproteobacteria bacterium]|nr:biotin transporter BioY [Alphaproteobacteria bacterium SS10]
MSTPMSTLAIAPATTTLMDRLIPVGDDVKGQTIRAVLLTIVGAQLLWISAKVQVPMWPVPMTMQTYAILALAGLAGWRVGLSMVALYLAQGAVGMPVFAGTPEKGIGLAYMMGPTGGYLLGFLMAAAVAGAASQVRGGMRLVSVVVGMTVAHLLVFIPGILWLGGAGFMDGGISAALAYNVSSFWLGTVLKTLLAIATIYGVWQLTSDRPTSPPSAS